MENRNRYWIFVQTLSHSLQLLKVKIEKRAHCDWGGACTGAERREPSILWWKQCMLRYIQWLWCVLGHVRLQIKQRRPKVTVMQWVRQGCIKKSSVLSCPMAVHHHRLSHHQKSCKLRVGGYVNITSSTHRLMTAITVNIMPSGQHTDIV